MDPNVDHYVRVITTDGELVMKTELMDNDEALAIFEDATENSSGVVVQLITDYDYVVSEELV